MENKLIELKICDEFRRLVQPITSDEFRSLEKKISQKTTAKIFVFNGIIVSCYEAYEIAMKLCLPIERISIPVNNYNEAIAWICRTQLKRNDLTSLMRKYLIGKRSLAEQTCERNRLHDDSGKTHACMGCIVTYTRTRLAKEYKYCFCTVRDYEACAKTIDTLFLFDREAAEMLLCGKLHILQKDLIAFAKLSKEQLKHKMENLLNEKYRIYEIPTIKNPPKYDPDAEISSLSLTIPSWVNLIERVQKTVTAQITEKAADEVFEKLSGLKEAAENFLVHIMEVL